MNFKKFEYELMIRENHLDSFGHVNNAVYVQLFEEARWDFITKNNCGLDKIQNEKIGPVILDLQVRFKRELKNRDKVRIESQVKEVVNSRVIILEQKIINSEGKVSTEAVFTVGFFDLKERKLINASDEWLHAVGIK